MCILIFKNFMFYNHLFFMEIGLHLGKIADIEPIFEGPPNGKGLVFIKFQFFQGFGIPGLEDLHHQLLISDDPGMNTVVRRFDLFQKLQAKYLFLPF